MNKIYLFFVIVSIITLTTNAQEPCFLDDFESGDSNWIIRNSADSGEPTHHIVDHPEFGKSLYSANGGQEDWAIIDDVFENFIFKAEFIYEWDNNLGIIFCYEDDDNFHAVEVSRPKEGNPGYSGLRTKQNGIYEGGHAADGNPDLGYLYPGNWTEEWKNSNPHGTFDEDLDINIMELKVLKGKATLTVNNEVQFEDVDLSFDTGQVGVYSNWGKGWYNNISIECIDQTTSKTHKAPTISIYPNPAVNGYFSISNSNFQENLTVEVFNILGESLLRHYYDNSSSSIVIDVNHLNNGLYLIHVESGSYSNIQKISILK